MARPTFKDSGVYPDLPAREYFKNKFSGEPPELTLIRKLYKFFLDNNENFETIAKFAQALITGSKPGERIGAYNAREFARLARLAGMHARDALRVMESQLEEDHAESGNSD